MQVKLISMLMVRTKIRFETEEKDNSEMVYCYFRRTAIHKAHKSFLVAQSFSHCCLFSRILISYMFKTKGGEIRNFGLVWVELSFSCTFEALIHVSFPFGISYFFFVPRPCHVDQYIFSAFITELKVHHHFVYYLSTTTMLIVAVCRTRVI